tara:strand:- start:290 stop:895 length:606 start_codon:yes stop_codon:yes gene_type:complete
MIKAIIFDWGGVCCSGADQFSAPVLVNHFQLPAIEINRKALDIENEFIKGKITKDEFWQQMIERLQVQEITNKEEIKDHYFNSYSINQDVLDLAIKLKENYQVLLLSNLNEEMGPNIEKKHNIREIFDPVIFSYEVKLMKPGEEIYKLTLNKINCKPEETVFIDDSQANIDAANKLGIKGIKFTTYENLIKDLKELKLISI